MNKSLKVLLIMTILTFATFSGVLGTKVISEEERLTKETTAIGGLFSFPAIYGDIVVWVEIVDIPEGGNAPYIVGYNLKTKERFQITDSGYAGYPAIYGDIVVWADFDSGEEESKPDIYGYNLKTKTEFQISDSGKAFLPAIYGDIVVWFEADIEGEGEEFKAADIFGYNLKAKERFQITKSGNAVLPAIYCDRVVWLDYRDGDIGELLDVYITYLDVVCGETKKSLPIDRFLKILKENMRKNHPEAEG